MIREKEQCISSGLMLLDYLAIIFGYLTLVYFAIWMPGMLAGGNAACDPPAGFSSFLTACEQTQSLLVFKSAYHRPEKLFVKRAMAIVVSLLIIVLFLPRSHTCRHSPFAASIWNKMNSEWGASGNVRFYLPFFIDSFKINSKCVRRVKAEDNLREPCSGFT